MKQHKTINAENIITKKLQSESGATIIIALVYFVIALSLGTAVLAAATANASHLATEKELEQQQLTVLSAMKVVQEKLDTNITGNKVEVDSESDFESMCTAPTAIGLSKIANINATSFKDKIVLDAYNKEVLSFEGPSLYTYNIDISDYDVLKSSLQIQYGEGREDTHGKYIIPISITISTADGEYKATNKQDIIFRYSTEQKKYNSSGDEIDEDDQDIVDGVDKSEYKTILTLNSISFSDNGVKLGGAE